MKARNLFELHGGAAPAPAAPTTKPAPVYKPGKEAPPPPRREPKFPNPFNPTRPGEKTTPKACASRSMGRRMGESRAGGVVDDLLETKFYARQDPNFGNKPPSATEFYTRQKCQKCGGPRSADGRCPKCHGQSKGASQSTSNAAPPNTIS